MIENIKIKNFKSLKDVNLELGNLCVFIGANGSGKSNFTDSLRFIRDSIKYDLNSAVSSRFGWKNILNKGQKSTERIKFEIRFNLGAWLNKVELENKELIPKIFNYSLSIGSKSNIPKVYNEMLKAEWEISKETKMDQFTRTENKVKSWSDVKELQFGTDEERKISNRAERSLILSSGSFFSLSAMILGDIMRSSNYYQLDVNSTRQPAYDENIESLAENGAKLPLLLAKLNKVENKDIQKRIKNLMSILVPEFQSWKTDRQFDATLGFKIFEKGIKDGLLPKMLSDGTIRLLAMLIALLFSDKRSTLISIDEPERCLHPQVLKPLVEIMRDVSSKTQVLVTTHSTEMVKWLTPDELYLVDKREGQTLIVRANQIESIDNFLDDFSLDEMWLSGYLKGGKVL